MPAEGMTDRRRLQQGTCRKCSSVAAAALWGLGMGVQEPLPPSGSVDVPGHVLAL
jgi:hypothetical protein